VIPEPQDLLAGTLGRVDRLGRIRESEGMAKPALGRGLGALLNASKAPPGKPEAAPAEAASGEGIREVGVEEITPCPLQPRRRFPEEELRELAASIRERGVLQPLILRPREGGYELIAGERRWRAAKLAGLERVPAVIREADDRAVLELALIENLQREDLNPIEEAQGYRQLIERFRLRQEDVARQVGKSRAAVANALRLLSLPEEVQALVREGRLSAGHAKALLAAPDEPSRKLAAARALKEGWSVRQTEAYVGKLQPRPADKPDKGGPSAGKDAPAVSAQIRELERKLQERLGTRVRLQYNRGRGAIEIRFFTDEDLERLLELLGVSSD